MLRLETVEDFEKVDRALKNGDLCLFLLLIFNKRLTVMKVSRKRAFVHNLLKALVIGGIVVVASTNPLFGIKAIGALQKDLRRKKWREFKGGLNYLKRRGFVEVEQNSDGSYSVKTTSSGKKQAEKYNLDNISIRVPKIWDNQWRMIIFDIPVEKQKGRLALLSKLRDLGFIMLQKSVWVHPFECRDEISVLARAFEVDKYVQHILCRDISAREYLKGEFEKRHNTKLT